MPLIARVLLGYAFKRARGGAVSRCRDVYLTFECDFNLDQVEIGVCENVRASDFSVLFSRKAICTKRDANEVEMKLFISLYSMIIGRILNVQRRI